jgi:thiopeptide-type bacteriocin biosynthesis protein
LESVTTRPIYKTVGSFFVRAPLWPIDAFEHMDSEMAILQSLPLLLNDARVLQALDISSPSLSTRLKELCANASDVSNKRATRAVKSLKKYLLRMSHRPTPFGTLAGIGAARFGQSTSLKLGSAWDAPIDVSVDYEWLMRLAKSALEFEGSDRFPLVPNPYLRRAGDRIEVAHADPYGTEQSVRVDARWTSALEVVLQVSKTGGSTRDAIAALEDANPSTPIQVLEDFVSEVISRGIVYPALLPGLEIGSETDRIVGTLRRGGRDAVRIGKGLSKVSRTLKETSTIRRLQEVHDGVIAEGERLEPGADRPMLLVNAGLNIIGGTLSNKVAARVEEAASILASTAFYPQREPHMIEYEMEFLERYGVGCEIPLLELLSASSGLEAPAGYSVPERTYPLRWMERQTEVPGFEVLITAYLAAVRSGGIVELSDSLIEAFASNDVRSPVPSVEYFVKVLAASAESIDSGDFDLVLLSDGQAPGARSAGRFAKVLDNLGETWSAIDAVERSHFPSDTEHVHLRYLPSQARMANVARTGGLGFDLIHVGDATGVNGSAIGLEDILIGNTGSGFYIRSLKTGKSIRIVENHLLTPLMAPNAVRLLVDIGRDQFRMPNAFDWGRLGGAPYLPRVSRGRTVFSVAQWNIDPTTMGKRGLSGSQLVDLAREEWDLPRHVVVAEYDQRMVLDLEQELDRALLSDELRDAQQAKTKVHLEEAIEFVLGRDAPGIPAQSPNAWLVDEAGASFAHEPVVPMILQAGAPRHDSLNRPGAPDRLGALTNDRQSATSHEWDSRWISLHLHGSLENLELVIAREMEALIGSTHEILDQWFFIRYSHPSHHLRIRLLAPDPSDVNELRERIVGWAQDLLKRKLIYDYLLSSFVPELNRYGGEACYRAAISVFEASSQLAQHIAQVKEGGTPDTFEEDVLGVALVVEVAEAMELSPSDLGVSPRTTDSFRRYYRSKMVTLMQILAGDARDRLPEANALPVDVRRRAAQLVLSCEQFAGTLKSHGVGRDRYLRAASSVLHMLFNRCFVQGVETERRSLELWTLAHGAKERQEAAMGGIHV